MKCHTLLAYPRAPGAGRKMLFIWKQSMCSGGSCQLYGRFKSMHKTSSSSPDKCFVFLLQSLPPRRSKAEVPCNEFPFHDSKVAAPPCRSFLDRRRFTLSTSLPWDDLRSESGESSPVQYRKLQNGQFWKTEHPG